MITLDLTGKNALITGGTRGIGRAITRRLAQAGANTLAVYRGDKDTADESLTERQAFGRTHRNLQADIAESEQVENLIAQTKTAYPDGLDILVLNAAAGVRGGPITDADPIAFQRMLDVNLKSAFLLCRGLIPVLRRGGSIVAISSGAGHDPIPGLTLYGASKAALNLFIADLAHDVGPGGIRANVVSPGATDTQFQQDAPSPLLAVPDEKQTTHNALGRKGVPDDVAQVVLFLCSDLSGFVTGQAIRVNGGAI